MSTIPRLSYLLIFVSLMAFSLLSYGIFLHKITYSVSKLALIIIVTNMVY